LSELFYGRAVHYRGPPEIHEAPAARRGFTFASFLFEDWQDEAPEKLSPRAFCQLVHKAKKRRARSSCRAAGCMGMMATISTAWRLMQMRWKHEMTELFGLVTCAALFAAASAQSATPIEGNPSPTPQRKLHRE
jgi:hypothetical protein